MKSACIASRIVAALFLFAAMTGAAFAADTLAARIDAVITGSGIHPLPSSIKREGSMTETIWISGDHVRVDFDAGPHLRGRILHVGEHAWLVSSDTARALPADGVAIGRITRLDPKQPCWDLGFPCQRLGNRTIAGRLVVGWRYRHAERAGPQGTDSGVFWIDAENGLLLGFEARDVAGRDYRMRAVSVDFGALDDAIFAMPTSVSQTIGDAR